MRPLAGLNSAIESENETECGQKLPDEGKKGQVGEEETVGGKETLEFYFDC